MVLSYLKKLKSEHPHLQIKQAKKLIDKKFLYSVNIRCPYARFIRNCTEGTSIEFSAKLSELTSSVNWKYSSSYFSTTWRDNMLDMAKQASPTQLEYLYKFLNKHKDTVSYRIEHPTMCIYFSDEDTFERFVCSYTLKYDIAGINGIRYFTCPFSDDDIELMKSGKCVRSGRSSEANAKYKYKVKLKGLLTNAKDLSNLLNYISHAEGEVYFAPVSKHTLERTIHRASTHATVWYGGSQFWTNDTSNIEPLSIICPGIIGRIEEYETTK